MLIYVKLKENESEQSSVQNEFAGYKKLKKAFGRRRFEWILRATQRYSCAYGGKCGTKKNLNAKLARARDKIKKFRQNTKRYLGCDLQRRTWRLNWQQKAGGLKTIFAAWCVLWRFRILKSFLELKLKPKRNVDAMRSSKNLFDIDRKLENVDINALGFFFFKRCLLVP